jgi:hypothetical protein
VAFGNVTTAGTFSGEYFHSPTTSMLNTILGSEAAGKINFELGPMPQLWTLDFTGSFLDGAVTTFRYDPLAIGPGPEADVRIMHYVNGRWETPAGQIVDTSAHTISVSLNSFSPFLIAATVPEPATTVLLAIVAMGLLLQRRVVTSSQH